MPSWRLFIHAFGYRLSCIAWGRMFSERLIHQGGCEGQCDLTSKLRGLSMCWIKQAGLSLLCSFYRRRVEFSLGVTCGGVRVWVWMVLDFSQCMNGCIHSPTQAPIKPQSCAITLQSHFFYSLPVFLSLTTFYCLTKNISTKNTVLILFSFYPLNFFPGPCVRWFLSGPGLCHGRSKKVQYVVLHD